MHIPFGSILVLKPEDFHAPASLICSRAVESVWRLRAAARHGRGSRAGPMADGDDSEEEDSLNGYSDSCSTQSDEYEVRNRHHQSRQPNKQKRDRQLGAFRFQDPLCMTGLNNCTRN
jgi:hypothetical protein